LDSHPYLPSFPTRRSSDLLAFRSDAVFVSGGARGLETIKEALKSESKAAPAGLLEISMSHLAPLILAAHGKNQDPEETKKHIQRSEEHTSELQSPYDLVCR